MIGVALGARVVAVDVNPAALERASALGAAAVVDAGAVADAAVAIREATGGGAHVSIDAFGSPELAVASVRGLRRRGRHVQAGLLLGPSSTPPLPMDLVVSQELEIYGSHGMPARDYPAMLALIEDGTLRPADLVGQVIGLEDAGAALAAMDRASTGGMTVVRIDPIHGREG
jgi:alcohol dehydrogenase